MLDRDQIRALVAREVALIEAPDRRAALEALLIEPRVEERTWDYAWPVVRYPYWVVAEAQDRSILLVYCDQGFGPGMPWGFLHAPHLARPSLGMDAQWGWYLEEAFGALVPLDRVREGRFGGELSHVSGGTLRPRVPTRHLTRMGADG